MPVVPLRNPGYPAPPAPRQPQAPTPQIMPTIQQDIGAGLRQTADDIGVFEQMVSRRQANVAALKAKEEAALRAQEGIELRREAAERQKEKFELEKKEQEREKSERERKAKFWQTVRDEKTKAQETQLPFDRGEVESLLWQEGLQDDQDILKTIDRLYPAPKDAAPASAGLLIQAWQDFKDREGRDPTREEREEMLFASDPSGNLAGSKVGKGFVDRGVPQLDLDKFNFQKQKNLQDRVKELGKDVKEIAPMGRALNDLKRALPAGGLVGQSTYDAIRGKFLTAYGLGEDPSIFAAVANSYFKSDPLNKRDLELKKLVDGDEEIQRLYSDPNFQRIIIPLTTLVNAVLKKTAGSAVSAQEFNRIKAQYGIDLFGSPESFQEGMRNLERIYQQELDVLKAAHPEEALEKFRGLDILEITPTAEPTISPRVQKALTAIEQNPDRTDDILKTLSFEEKQEMFNELDRKR